MAVCPELCESRKLLLSNFPASSIIRSRDETFPPYTSLTGVTLAPPNSRGIPVKEYYLTMNDVILNWNAVAIEANRVSHTDGSKEQNGPTLSSRALGIVHLAMYDAYARVTGTPVAEDTALDD